MATHYGHRPGIAATLACIACDKPVTEDDSALDVRADLHIDCAPEYHATNTERAIDNLIDAARGQS